MAIAAIIFVLQSAVKACIGQNLGAKLGVIIKGSSAAHDVPGSGIHMRPQVAARDQTRNIFVKS